MTLRNLVEEWNAKNDGKYSPELINKFCEYWEKDGKWDNQKTFKIGGRLSTFSRMSKKFEKENLVKSFKRMVERTKPL